MFENLINLDKRALVYLNSLGSSEWDSFWLYVTNQRHWAPVFIVVLFLFFKFLGWKKGLFSLLFIAFFVAFSDQFVNMIRSVFERLRPNNDPNISEGLRTFINPQSYSFISGHATTSMALTIFSIHVLRGFTKYIYIFLLFPLFFAYSRLYLGVHFPLDILVGSSVGFLLGIAAYRLFSFSLKAIFK